LRLLVVEIEEVDMKSAVVLGLSKLNRLALLAVVWSIGTSGSASFAQTNINCSAVVRAAAVTEVDKTEPLGQSFVLGQPVLLPGHVLRLEVEVFGSQTETYAVDVKINDACQVVSTSSNLEEAGNEQGD
jgi:hypothetical protein